MNPILNFHRQSHDAKVVLKVSFMSFVASTEIVPDNLCLTSIITIDLWNTYCS